MIPKAELMSFAEESGLLPTTIEKDHALGWILFGIAEHPVLSRWLFKGGT
jgi:predicted nucleotidyltransferase component of viral defense system